MTENASTGLLDLGRGLARRLALLALLLLGLADMPSGQGAAGEASSAARSAVLAAGKPPADERDGVVVAATERENGVASGITGGDEERAVVPSARFDAPDGRLAGAAGIASLPLDGGRAGFRPRAPPALA